MNTEPSAILSKSSAAETNNFPFSAIIALILGAIGIGLAPILVRLSSVGSSATGFWRVTLALPFFILFAYIKRHGVKTAKTSDYYWALLSGVFFASDLAIWHLSIHYTTVANASLLCNFVPIFIALWSWVILKKPPTTPLMIALLLILSGGYLLAKPSATTALMNHSNLGNALALATAVLYTGYLLCISRISSTFGTYKTMAYSAISAALILFLIATSSHETIIPTTVTGWSVLLGLALGSQILGQGLIIYALPFLPLTFTACTLIIQPIVAALLGWLLFGESLSSWQFIGMLCALAGIYCSKVNR